MNHPDDTTPDWLLPARAELARLQPDAAQAARQLARLTHLQQAHHAHQRQARGDDPHESHEPRWLRRLAWGSGALGATAAVLLTTLLLLDPPGMAPAQAASGPGSGFIPLVPEGDLRAALAVGRGAAVWLQPAELPRERLALLGLPFDAARAADMVRAELMLNPDGQLLAVRILD